MCVTMSNMTSCFVRPTAPNPKIFTTMEWKKTSKYIQEAGTHVTFFCHVLFTFFFALNENISSWFFSVYRETVAAHTGVFTCCLIKPFLRTAQVCANWIWFTLASFASQFCCLRYTTAFLLVYRASPWLEIESARLIKKACVGVHGL